MSRKIRYSGYSFASILTPAQILGANYYDHWQPSGLTGVNGDPILTWLSDGLNAATFTFGVGQRPTVLGAAINGYKAASFNGTTDYGQVLASTGMYNFMHDGSGGTIYAILRFNNLLNGEVYVLFQNLTSASGVGITLYNDSRTTKTNAIQSGVRNGSSSISFQESNNFWSSGQFDSMTHKLDVGNPTPLDRCISIINGGSEIKTNTQSGSPSLLNATGNLIIGSTNTGAGLAEMEVAEIIIADTITTPTQDSQMDLYLQNKYGTFPI